MVPSCRTSSTRCVEDPSLLQLPSAPPLTLPIAQAAVRAARIGKKLVSASDFEWAKDRVMLGAERKSAVITPEDKKL